MKNRNTDRASPLAKQLISIVASRRVSLEALERESGVSVNTMYGWAKGYTPRLDLYIAVAGALGYELKLVRRKTEGT